MPGFYSGPPVGYAALEAEGSEAVPLARGGVFARGIGEGIAANLGPRLLREAGREAATTGVIGVNELTGEPITVPPEPAMDTDAAEQKYGIAGRLKFTAPVPESVARDLHEHHTEQMKREADYARAEPGVLTTANRFTANLLAGFLDPVNLAVGMVPIAGEAAWATRFVQAASSAVGRAGARAVIGGIEGGIGQAALEPLSYWLSTQERDDYTMADSLRNIALGTVMGGGLHAGIGAVVDRVGGTYRNPVARGLDEAGPDVRHGILEGSLGQTIAGDRVDVSSVLGAADAIRTSRMLEGGIAGDVERKLVAAGRPADEARASGRIWQALYDTHAERFAGRLGTAEELYLREGPDILRGATEAATPGGRAADPLDTRARLDALDAQLRALEVAHEGATTGAERAPLAAEIGRLTQERAALGAGAPPTARPGYRIEPVSEPPADAKFPGQPHNLINPQGEKIGTAYITKHDDGTATLDWVEGPVASNYGANREAANTLGPRAMRDIARSYFEQNPDIQNMTGERITGARREARPWLADSDPGEMVTITRGQALGRAWFDPAVQAEAKAAAAQQTAAPRELRQEAAPAAAEAQQLRNLTVLDILDPATPSRRPRSAGVETVAAELEARGQAALRELGVESGRITGPAPETDAILARAIALEIADAMQRSGNAGDWYTGKITEAMQIASAMHPELAYDDNARMLFTAALAITSQGETVGSNVRLADRAYRAYKEQVARGINRPGVFPTDVVAKNAASMNANFGKLNQLLDDLGADGAREFLSREFTVRELERQTGVTISGENKDTMVYGSAIFGPKIGNGFFQNLNGNFRPVTMDLWFMRAWGRLTGTLIGLSEEAVEKQRTRFTDALRAEGRPVPDTHAGIAEAAEAIERQHERDYRRHRAEFDNGTRVKSELSKSAIALQKGLSGINEQPRTGSQRIWMRSVVNGAREILEEQGIRVTNADLQALWWYPEKDLYGKMGSRPSEEVNADYAGELRALAQRQGVSDAELARAVGALDYRLGPAGEADVAGATQEARGGSGQVAGPQTYYQGQGRAADRGDAAAGIPPETRGGTDAGVAPARTVDVGGEPRGKISLADPVAGTRALITLMRDADASTFMHETGHDWLERLVRDAADPDAPAGLVRDVGTVRDWLGIKAGEPISVEAHEKFATAFEQYLREGKAPTPALQSVFDQFRDWLVKIYRTIAGLGEPISDDIRGIFDRMLALPEDARVEATPTGVRVEATPPASRAAAPAIERAAAAGEPDGPVPADTLTEISAQAEQLERLRRAPGEGEGEAVRPAAAVEIEADAEAHANAFERASLCVTGGYA